MVPLAQPPNSLAEPNNTMPHSLSELHSRLASLSEPIESYETDKEGTPDERELPALDNNRLAPEVDESYEDMSPEPSPLPHRRSIKSSESDSENHLGLLTVTIVLTNYNSEDTMTSADN